MPALSSRGNKGSHIQASWVGDTGTKRRDEDRLTAELVVAKNYTEGRYKGKRAKLSLVGHVPRDNGPTVQFGMLRSSR